VLHQEKGCSPRWCKFQVKRAPTADTRRLIVPENSCSPAGGPKNNRFWRQKYPKSISGANGLSYSQMKVARLGGTSIKSIGHLQPTLDTSSSPRTPGEQLFSSWRPKNNGFWRQKYPKFISGANGLSYSQRKVAGLGGTSFKSNGHLQPALDASSSPRTLGEQLENTRCRM
jgi:hypothetical protein